jgi:hypothetical protein
MDLLLKIARKSCQSAWNQQKRNHWDVLLCEKDPGVASGAHQTNCSLSQGDRRHKQLMFQRPW